MAMVFAALGALLPQLLGQEFPHRPDIILVKPKAGTTELAAIHGRLGTQVRKSFQRFGNLQVVKLRPGANLEATIEEYQRSGLVEYAEPDYYITFLSQKLPNDIHFGSLWNMHNTADADIDAPEAWYFRTDAQGVIVAVIDTGVNYLHEDLAANMWVNPGEIAGNSVDDDGNGYTDDVYGINTRPDAANRADPIDGDGHGSHVAGIVGAVGNNGTGVVGVAWRVQLMALNGGVSISEGLLECIDYAIAKGAHIINASWMLPHSQSLLDAIRTTANHGIIWVAAAGNSGDVDLDTVGLSGNRFPAGYDVDNIVTVAATTRTNTLAAFSTFGRVRVHLAAPGGVMDSSTNDILSIGLGNLGIGSTNYLLDGGTSMAAPHVAGAFALMKAQFPNDSYLQLINRVFSTVDQLSALDGKCVTGGRLNLHKAITSTSSRPRNDDFSLSYGIVVPGGQTNITATGNNVDATTQAAEPLHGGGTGERSVWWHWPSPASAGTAEIRSQGSTFNTRLAVYTGSVVSNLTLVASNNVSDGCSWSQVNFSYAASTTYRIAVDGYNGAVGSIKLTMQTNSSTTQTNLSFDRTTVVRASGQFRVTVYGPANQSVTLDRFSASRKYWTNLTSFTLSGSGVYNYTNTSATNTHEFYRCQIGSLKSCNSVGYADVAMPSGYSMIANPLNAVDNRVNAVLPNVPDGTYLHKFNEVTDQYYEVNAFISGSGWIDTNMTLAPGEGAIIQLPSATTVSFIGECQQGYLINPVLSGHSIRSAKAPISGPVTSGLGTPILEGDIIIRMISGTYQHYAYHNGLWISIGAQVSEPVINLGESFWINKPTDWQQISSVWP